MSRIEDMLKMAGQVAQKHGWLRASSRRDGLRGTQRPGTKSQMDPTTSLSWTPFSHGTKGRLNSVGGIG